MKKINYFIGVKRDEFIVYAIAPIGADCEDTQMMANMAEFIARENYGLRNGCFEIDYDDGEIRYRSFVDCDDPLPSKKVVKTVFTVQQTCLNGMLLVFLISFLAVQMQNSLLRNVRM